MLGPEKLQMTLTETLVRLAATIHRNKQVNFDILLNIFGFTLMLLHNSEVMCQDQACKPIYTSKYCR